uniref:Uncharacterized protein n=1 Tax=Anguilla anguilla TaxID=7936 RepID=A0A0E9XIN5_ANGAN
MNSTLLVGACEAVVSKLVKLLKQLHCHRLTIKLQIGKNVMQHT